MARNKFTIEDLLGLKDSSIELHLGLEEDLLKIINEGNDKYLQDIQAEQHKKEEFLRLFRTYYQDIIHIIMADPRQQIAVNCAGCRYANRIDLGNGKATTKRSKTNGKKPTI